MPSPKCGTWQVYRKPYTRKSPSGKTTHVKGGCIARATTTMSSSDFAKWDKLSMSQKCKVNPRYHPNCKSYIGSPKKSPAKRKSPSKSPRRKSPKKSPRRKSPKKSPRRSKSVSKYFDLEDYPFMRKPGAVTIDKYVYSTKDVKSGRAKSLDIMIDSKGWRYVYNKLSDLAKKHRYTNPTAYNVLLKDMKMVELYA